MTTQNIGPESTANVAEPIVKSGGESMTSFEELETVLEAPSTPKPKTSKPKEDGEASGKKEAKAPKEDAQYEGADDEKEAKKSAKEKAEAKGEKKEDDKAEKDASKKDVESERAKVKLYKAKSEDGEVDLKGDAKFTVMVNGKPEVVSVQDVINNYAGKTDWNRKYSELETERKAFHKDRSTFEQSIDEILKAVDTSPEDPEPAVRVILDKLGYDPDKLLSGYRAKLLSEFEEMKDLTPEQRRLRELEKENQTFKKRDETLKLETQTKRKMDSLGSHVKKLQESFGIDDATFVSLHKELTVAGHLKGLSDEDAATFIAKFHGESQSRSQINNLLMEIAPQMADEERATALEDLRQLQLINPTWTQDDLKQIANQVYGENPTRKLAKKVARNGSADAPKAPVVRKENPISFDEVE